MKEFIQEKNLTNAKDATIHLTQKVIPESMKGFVTIEKTYECKNQNPKSALISFSYLEIFLNRKLNSKAAA